MSDKPVMCIIIFSGKRAVMLHAHGVYSSVEEVGGADKYYIVKHNNDPDKRLYCGGPFCSLLGK